jgi:transcriptional regulator with XRE-family HTH domain
MGRASRSRPDRLPEKLLQVRQKLGISQDGLVRRLGLVGKVSRAKISEFERGEREPALPILLQYARAAGVWMDVLVDDELDLPEKITSGSKHEGVRRNMQRKGRSRSV